MNLQNVDWNQEWNKVTSDFIPPALGRRIEMCVEGALRNLEASEGKGDSYLLILAYRQQVNGSPIEERRITAPQDAVEQALLEGLSSTGKELWLIDGYKSPRHHPSIESDEMNFYPYYALKLK